MDSFSFFSLSFDTLIFREGGMDGWMDTNGMGYCLFLEAA